LTSDDFEIDQVNWSSCGNPEEPIEVTVKIVTAILDRADAHTGENGRARVQLHEPQKAITPGQAAVFYDEIS